MKPGHSSRGHLRNGGLSPTGQVLGARLARGTRAPDSTGKRPRLHG